MKQETDRETESKEKKNLLVLSPSLSNIHTWLLTIHVWCFLASRLRTRVPIPRQTGYHRRQCFSSGFIFGHFQF